MKFERKPRKVVDSVLIPSPRKKRSPFFRYQIGRPRSERRDKVQVQVRRIRDFPAPNSKNRSASFCQQFCQQEVPVSCVFHSSQEPRRGIKSAQNRPKTRKIITEET